MIFDKKAMAKANLAEQDAQDFVIREVFHAKKNEIKDERHLRREGDFRLSNGDAVEVKADFSGWHRGTLPVEFHHSGRKSGDCRGWLDHLLANKVRWLTYIHFIKENNEMVVAGATVVGVPELAAAIEAHKGELETSCCTDQNGERSHFYRVPMAVFFEADGRRVVTAHGLTPDLPAYLREHMVKLVAQHGGGKIGKARFDFVSDPAYAVVDV